MQLMRLMRPASRRAFADARQELDALLDSATEAQASTLGEELFSAVDVLLAEPVLRRHLADASTDVQRRSQLLAAVFGRTLGASTMRVLDGLVGARWSQVRDLVDAAETLARLALLAVAEKQGAIEDAEDELFRAGRLVDREPTLASLLGDTTAPVQRRIQLLRDIVAGKVHAVTERLLVRALQAPRGRPIDRAAEDLAELAAARRQRSIARVSTPIALTDEQHDRLAAALSRVYGRPMSLQIELAPELLGGLVVRVGDELIDGSIAGRLTAARQRLPH